MSAKESPLESGDSRMRVCFVSLRVINEIISRPKCFLIVGHFDSPNHRMVENKAMSSMSYVLDYYVLDDDA